MATLGERLRARRHELGLTIDEISQRTRIRPSILEALEADEPGPLPPVYMRQFARRYAEFVGIPEEELQQLLAQRFGRSVGPPVVPSNQQVSRRKAVEQRLHVVNALLYGGLVGAVIAVGYYFFLRPKPEEVRQVTAPEVFVQPANTAAADAEQVHRAVVGDTIWQLRARARDTVWLSIIVDGKQSEQFILEPGQERQWSVRRIAVLSVGNAGGVELWRNGEALPPLGPRGSVVRSVRISADSLWTSAGPLPTQVPPERRQLPRPPSSGTKQNASETPPRITPAAPLRTLERRPEPQKPLPPP